MLKMIISMKLQKNLGPVTSEMKLLKTVFVDDVMIVSDIK